MSSPETFRIPAVNDRIATQLQETGCASTQGLTLADLVLTVDAIGLRPEECSFRGSSLLVDRTPIDV